VSIPDFDSNGNLPPGAYTVSLEEIEERTERRQQLLTGLKAAIANLAQAHVKRVWIDGSFVTAKDEPNDIDGCWEYDNDVDVDALDPVFLDLHPPREAMKDKLGVDFLIANIPLSDAGDKSVEEFFQIDRDGNRKGILILELE